MRKWSPEIFTATIETPAPSFEEWPGRNERQAGREKFRNAFDSEAKKVSDPPQEDLRRELQDQFNTRAAEMEAEYGRRLAEVRKEFTQSVTAWRDNWTDLQERRVRRLAEDAGDLAVMIAEKIIRERANQDRDMLIRSLETALFKIQAESEITVLVHPDDAFWLEMDEELCERLRIGAVVPDRRVDPGGCRIKAGAEEWDATVKTQLAALADLVKGALVDTDLPEDSHGSA